MAYLIIHRTLACPELIASFCSLAASLGQKKVGNFFLFMYKMDRGGGVRVREGGPKVVY